MEDYNDMSFGHLFPNVCGQQMTKGGQKNFFHLKKKQHQTKISKNST